MDAKILSKIQKLLCLAADNPDSHESKLAAERAGDMMAKYNIGLEDVTPDGTLADSGIDEIMVGANSRHHQVWESQLGAVLCDCFDCKRLLIKTHKGAMRQFIGTKSDVQLLVWFYKYLRLRIAKHAEHEWQLQSDQKSFGLGAVEALTPRLKEMYKKKNEVVMSDCRDLVINKQLAVNNFFTKKYPNLRKSSYSMKTGSKQAVMSGIAAGKTMSINQQIGG